MSAQPIVTTANDYQPLNVLGEQISVLASGSATGSYEVFHQTGPEGAGPPPHSHDWDEGFFVTSGEVEFGIGNDTKVAQKGTFVHLPAGTMHWFRFGKGGAEMVSLTSRNGASAMFADMDREISVENIDFEKLAGIAMKHGLVVAP